MVQKAGQPAGNINFSVIKQNLENFLNNDPYPHSERLYCASFLTF